MTINGAPFHQRPKWAEALRMFLADGIYDDQYDYPVDGSDDKTLNSIEAAVNEIMCNAYGHEIVDDQCMIPEHRYCVYCSRRATDLV